MKTIILYSRVSTQDQNYQSQFDDLRKWAEVNNFNIVKTFGEKVSGYSLEVERIEYDKMKEYVIKNKIKHIAVWELSRFSRNTRKTLEEIDYFKENEVNIFFKKENIWTLSNEPTTKLVLTLLSSIAEMERNTIIERSTRGKISAAMRGKAVNYGILPYGYCKDENGALDIQKEEAKTIKIIYELAIKGKGVGFIATYLNSLGIPTRHTLNGKKRILNNNEEITVLWRQNTVRRILHSKVYIGEGKYRDLDLKIPAIIDIEQWNKVQERFKNNVGNINSTKYNYLFKGKIRCGKCGLAYLSYNRNGQGSYFCSGRKDKGIKCKNGGFSSTFLDEKLWGSLYAYRDFFTSSKNDYDNKQQQTEIRRQIEFFNGEVEKLEQKKKRLAKMFVEGYYTEDNFNKEQSALRNQITDFGNKKRVLENMLKKDDKMDWPKYLVKVLTSKDFNVRREAVENLIDRVLIYKVVATDILFTRTPTPQEKMVYIEMYAYNSPTPLKLVLTSVFKNSEILEEADYNKETKFLSGKVFKPSKIVKF